MKKLQKIMLWMAILPLLMVMSCKDDDPAPADDNFTKLSEYMIAQNLDLGTVLTDWIVAAPAATADVNTFLGAYHVYDIRLADDYGVGHATGAINSSLGTIVADAASVTKPILVICYTGQTASHAVVALRLSGHTNAKVLKFGMSSWRAELAGSWEANSGTNGNIAVGNSNWTTDATATLADYNHPTWTSSTTDMAVMLAERVTVMTTSGFKGIPAADVLASPSSFFTNNFWDQGDVDTYGHISSAARIKPLTLATDEFKHLDASQTIVTYCWTGQTSSMVTAYLTVMGYDAKSLKFGVNSMIYDAIYANMAHPFITPTTDLPVVQ